jgi:hydrogenase maturation factor
LRSTWKQGTLTCEMCLGKIERIAEVWEDGGTRVARSECGIVLSLAFAPEAEVGSHVLAHAGVAVRVLDPGSAEDAEALREAMQA